MSTTDGRSQLCFSNGHSSDLPLSAPHLSLKRVRWGNKKIKKCLDLERRGTGVALGQLHFFCRKQTQSHQLFKIGWRGKTLGEHTEILMKKYPCKKEGLRSCPCVYAQGVCSFFFFGMYAITMFILQSSQSCSNVSVWVSVCLWSPLFTDTLCWMRQLTKEPERSRSCRH